jgi:SAM-dependent methyltransferase
LGEEINLMADYPRTRRDVSQRGETKTEEDRAIARRFGREFFDGDRRHGYGGYRYHPRFWQPVIPAFRDRYGLTASSRVLDVGCAKGFMLYDMTLLIPGIGVAGLDVSSYAVADAVESLRPNLLVGDARALPFADHSFDLVISITTVHNLEREDCAQALREIQRVGRGASFITVDAYRSEAEKDAMLSWNLTARTVMHADQWKAFFSQVGFTGDYYWFIP